MLSIAGLNAAYGKVSALENVSLKVEAKQIVCLLGANGAGKTTTLNCVSGLVATTAGRIEFGGEDIGNLRAEDIVKRGVVQVPEGREIFAAMSVEDNLTLGAWQHRDRVRNRQELDRVYDLFPRLRERKAQFAGTLSGGEQQMLMIGRALMAKPKLLMLDEPSLGLSPILIQQVFDIIKTIHASGIAILLVEQNARIALNVSSYGYILENGEVILHGPADTLAQNPRVHEAYLGGGAARS
ncbi:MAG: ABC transporter ATP-binding protein [Xanthobacteraceae bacterium]|nr:ABC transporter ATP-binding protein [Xanthobacteraceae bacterium]